jgi:NAD(P)-dependent dehydrogenase (short-subunit alcohol dehydrogenase family)
MLLVVEDVAAGNRRLRQVIDQDLLAQRQRREAVGVQLDDCRVLDGFQEVPAIAAGGVVCRRRGARVVVNNRRPGDQSLDSSQDVAREIERSGGTALVEHSDVSTPAGVAELVRNALAAYGRIDAVVHNAGMIEGVGVADLTDDTFARVFDINAASARVLDKLGISLVKVHGAGCCGAVTFHLNRQEDGRDYMRRNIDAWWPHVESGVEAIVITASGCGTLVKEYGHHLA